MTEGKLPQRSRESDGFLCGGGRREKRLLGSTQAASVTATNMAHIMELADALRHLTTKWATSKVPRDRIPLAYRSRDRHARTIRTHCGAGSSVRRGRSA